MSLESEFISNISELESSSSLSSPSLTYPLGPVLPHEHHVLSQWLTSQGVPQRYSAPHHARYLPSSVSSTTTTLPPNYILLPAHKSLSQGVLRFLSSAELRKRIFSKLSSQPLVNLPLLCRLIIARHQLSQLIGYHSFNERTLKRKVLKDSESVLKMLKRLSEATEQKTKREVRVLEELKEKVTTTGEGEGESNRLFPWDIRYLGDLYSQTQRQHHPSSSSSSSTASSSPRRRSHDEAAKELSQYCHLETCLKGLEFVCRSLFDITLVREEHFHETEELWTEDPRDIIKYTLYHPSSSTASSASFGHHNDLTPLGTIYLDPFTRDYKFGGASHFTIRCGCSNVSSSSSSSPLSSSSSRASYQLPIVALIFSFPRESGDNSLFLTTAQLENLYHEWGHALHSLLSRTKFQHLSGTRGPADFVEVHLLALSLCSLIAFYSALLSSFLSLPGPLSSLRILCS
jgi:mitochondrial intermediate peptidase